MSFKSEKREIAGVVTRLCDNLAKTVSSKVGREGVILRYRIGDLRSNYDLMLRNDTFTARLLACFTAANEANVKLESFVVVHNGLFAERPVGDVSIAIIQAATVFCLSTESRMITRIEFVSRDDIDVMMARMRLAFDTARDLASDSMDSSTYQALTALAGSLVNHLANVARPLPRMVTFKVPATVPALALSQRLYYNATRWNEILQENKTIHPAFVQREIRGLSS